MGNVAAYTKRDQVFPGYLNVTHADDGSVVVTVRGDPNTVDGVTAIGATVALRLSVDEWTSLLRELASVVQLPGVEQ